MARIDNLKKVKIVYTKESGRPPMYTTDKNLENQEKFFSNIIAEVILLDDKGNEIKNEAVVRPVIVTNVKDESFVLPVGDNSLPEIIRNSMPPKTDATLKSIVPNESPKSMPLDLLYAELMNKGKTKEEIDVFLAPKLIKVDKRFKKSKTEQKV
jgi:hypothetical protein